MGLSRYSNKISFDNGMKFVDLSQFLPSGKELKQATPQNVKSEMIVLKKEDLHKRLQSALVAHKCPGKKMLFFPIVDYTVLSVHNDERSLGQIGKPIDYSEYVVLGPFDELTEVTYEQALEFDPKLVYLLPFAKTGNIITTIQLDDRDWFLWNTDEFKYNEEIDRFFVFADAKFSLSAAKKHLEILQKRIAELETHPKDFLAQYVSPFFDQGVPEWGLRK